MLKDPLYKLSAKLIVAIVAAALLCRYTLGYGIGVIGAVGFFYALRGKAGVSLFIYLLIPFLTMANPILMPRLPFFSMGARITTLFVAVGLVLGGSKRKGNEQLPLAYLFYYLVIATISSFQGYFPLISYFKILNFSAFIVGIYIGTKNINQKPEDLFFVRAGFLAFGLLLVYGSLATLPFPSIAYFTSVRELVIDAGIDAAEEALLEMEGTGLFTGITSHSQFLGPALACFSGWVACDMLFVERRMRVLHLALLFPIPIIIAMTRARIGVLTFCTIIVFLGAYCLPRIRISERRRHKIKAILGAFVVVFVATLFVIEARNGTVSRLLRKTNDMDEDRRSLLEALTNSRQGLIAACLHDFHQNPLWGTGFQVIEKHIELYQQGKITLFSAPIEKGLLPLMVLGETGIMGFTFFFLFVFMFYHDVTLKRYAATSTLFSAFLVSNLAEATFFSPGGSGGVLWMFTVCGGFLIDMSLKATNDVLSSNAAKGVAPLSPYRRSRIPLSSVLKR